MISQNEETQEIVFTPDETKEVVDALREIFTTGIGRTYKRSYYTEERGDEDLEKILRAAQLVTGRSEVSARAMARGLELLIDSGELQPRDLTPAAPLEEPEERPTDKNGRPLTDGQIAWSEMRRFAETASMVEISKRKSTDPAFATFVRKNWERQLAQPVGDAVVPAGETNLLPRHTPDQHLVEFARKFQSEPSQNLKPRNGLVILAGEQLPYSQFIDLVNKATAARLL